MCEPHGHIATPIARGLSVPVADYARGGAAGADRHRNNVSRARYFTNGCATPLSSVLVGDFLYGFSSSILTAMHYDTGKVAWRDRSVGKGSVVVADGRLYLFSENGVVGLADPDPSAYVERGRFQLKTGSLPTWSHPVVAGGRLYLRDQDTLYAYDVAAR